MSQAVCSICSTPLPGQARSNRLCRPCSLARWAEHQREMDYSKPCPNCGQSRARSSKLCRSCYEISIARLPCSVEGCDKPSNARGLCPTHYSQVRRAGWRKKPPPKPRVCRVCGIPVTGRVCEEHRAKQKYVPKQPKTCVVCGIETGRRQRCPEHPLLRPRKSRAKDPLLGPPNPFCPKGHLYRWTSGGNKFCRECRKVNPRYREAKRAERHRRRDLLNAGNLTTAEWLEVLDTLGRKCFYCPGPFEEMDHVIPLARGGRHTKDNVVPACQKCNHDKGAFLVEEWRENMELSRAA